MAEDLQELITKSRPTAKSNTIKIYERNIKYVMNGLKATSYDFVKNIDEVMTFLSNKHTTTQRNYLNALIILMLALNHDKVYDETIKKYDEQREKLTEQYDKDQENHIISDKQKPNFISFQELKDMIEKIGNDLKGFKKRELSGKELLLLNMYVILQIHIRLPLRNDLAGMISINKRTYNKLTEQEKETTNYLVIEKGNIFISLNEYKTKRKYKEVKLDVPKDLQRLIRSFIKIVGMGVMFKSSAGSAISRNQLSQLLIKTSQSYIQKNISTTIIRKIVLSELFAQKNKEKEQMAKICCHSTSTMDKTYIKQPQEETEEA
tara:strand:+ start:696 stop:1655 length:960 start_codon:yes stop_codon:yes gene_type:complete